MGFDRIMHTQEYWETRRMGVIGLNPRLIEAFKSFACDEKMESIGMQHKNIKTLEFLSYELSKKDLRSGSLVVKKKIKSDTALLFSFFNEERFVGIGLYLERYRKYLDINLIHILIDGNLWYSFRLNLYLKIRDNSPTYATNLGVDRDYYSYMISPLGDEVIDHYNSPFRIFNRNGLPEAVGSEMWLGKTFWEKTGASLVRLREIEGIEIKEMLNDVLYVRLKNPFGKSNEQRNLAAELRRVLFPITFNRDRSGRLRETYLN